MRVIRKVAVFSSTIPPSSKTPQVPPILELQDLPDVLKLPQLPVFLDLTLLKIIEKKEDGLWDGGEWGTLK